MDQFLEIFYPVAVLFAPLVTYWLVAKRQRVTRRDTLIATTLAGSGVGIALALALVIAGAPIDAVVQVWPWVFLSGAVGFVLGLLMLLARSAGGWLSDPP